MSFIYDYKPADSLPHFDCADGIHKVKIAGVRFASSKNGKQFLAISLEVEGSALPFVQNALFFVRFYVYNNTVVLSRVRELKQCDAHF